MAFMPNKKKIDAMIIGADRSGSTWLRTLCGQNPDIYICPVSQQEFLSKQEAMKRRIFTRLKFNCPMDSYAGEKMVVGVRNISIHHGDKVANLYYSHNKNMKFIMSVRNPIERTFSQYITRMSSKIKKGDPRRFFDINMELDKSQRHVRSTMVYSLLKPYLELFPKNNFHIYPMELMKQETAQQINKVYSFLGAKRDIDLHNETKLINPRNTEETTYVPLNDHSKAYLANLVMEETKALSDLVGMDLVKFWDLESYL